jgi:hypothetical protein
MANEFSRSAGKQISKVEAEKQIDKFDKERKKDTKSVFFGTDAIQTLLNVPGSTGISFFFSRKFDNGQKKDVDDVVMVATAEDGTLLWTNQDPASGGTSNTFDFATTCPPYCPK